MIGQTLGHYKILDKLGAGGMGEVYRAKDTTLDREVALKILPPELAESQERLDRFQREAKTLAALDHPNIVTVFTVEQDESVHFLTMQLVEGQRLTELIAPDGMPLDGILEVAIPLAAALADAHEHGVIHRDLKPSNIMISNQGRVKILDFGLAKLKQAPEPEMASQLPTEPLTEEGRLLGTAPYMSPEQIEAKALDSRSDIFSLGIILYEMASGRRPFEGESSTSVMARILETEPEQLGERRPDLQPEFLRIVRRCLRKKPEDRYNDTRDLQVALKDLSEETTSGISLGSGTTTTQRRPVRTRHPRFLWTAFLVALVLAAAVGLWWLSARPRAAAPVAVSPEHQQLTFSGVASRPAISADGNWVAFVEFREEGRQRVLVREAAAGKAIEVLEADEIFDIEWSPDGSQLIVAAMLGDNVEGNYILPRLGGSRRSIGFRLFGLLSWSPDGMRIAGTAFQQKEVWLMDADSGETDSIQLAGSFEWLNVLDWSPSGRFLLFVTSDSREIYTVEIISTDGTVQHRLIQEGRSVPWASWAAIEDAIYYLGVDGPSQSLIKLRINPDTGERVGQPQTLLTGQEMEHLDVSAAAGRLVHAATSYVSNLWEADLSSGPGNTCGRPTQLTFGTANNESPEYSPDGESMAFVRGPLWDWEVHILSLADHTFSQLTFSEGNVRDVAWSRDSASLAYILEEEDRVGVWTVNATGDHPRLLERTTASVELSWSPGQDIVYQLPGNRNFSLLDPETGDQQPLLEDDSLGWIFDVISSREEDRVAFFWNRKQDERVSGGLWVITLADRTAQPVYETSSRPFDVVRWSHDARWIYTLRGEFDQRRWVFWNPELMKIPADGTTPPKLVCELPFEAVSVGSLDVSEERGTVVASVAKSESDIWLISNFDPELN